MIPRADIVTVAQVARVSPAGGVDAVGEARQQDFQRALSGLVGKSMPAEVLSRLTDGSFLVKVAGTPARMLLPSQPQLQPGAAIALTLVSLTPRPTFQLSNSPQSAVIAAFVDPHPQAGLAGAAGEPALYTPSAGIAKLGTLSLASQAAPNRSHDAGAASSHSTFSSAARVISSVLGAAARSEHPQTSVVAPLPLLAAAPGDAVKLAAQLKDAIGASGLFYESHLAEWSAGKRPLAELQREPQMQREVQVQREAQGQREVQSQRAAGADSFAPPPGGALVAAAADPAAAQFINLQLASQEQGRVAWQGQLLPGQEMAWEISRDPPDASERSGAGEETLAPPWRSTLRLRFAALGAIGATVVLSGDQLHIALETGSNDIGNVLRARVGQLQRALEASGNPAATLTVTSAVTSALASSEPGHD
jgi:hypothetical protein